MIARYFFKPQTLALFLLALSVGLGCSTDQPGKIPITTSSARAKKLYIEGRSLADRLRAVEASSYFERAIEADPEFALAHLALAATQPSAKGFFEELEKAVDLVEGISEGERLLILARQAGTHGEQEKQLEQIQQLIELYPDDERAHLALANFHFNQRDLPEAIAEYTKAIEIEPDFSIPYNQLGYCYRFLEDFDAAEEAFEKYTELIPDDPNPYDSYAELLLRVGKFEESIAMYKKALSFDSRFIASHMGIAANYMFMEKHKDAHKQVALMYKSALNDGQRRQAYFTRALTYLDQRDYESSLTEIDEMFLLAEKIQDPSAMAGDLRTAGFILLWWGETKEAEASFNRALAVVDSSSLSPAVKHQQYMQHLVASVIAAAATSDTANARTYADEYQQEAESGGNSFQERVASALQGMAAYVSGQYESAIALLSDSDPRNPYYLYVLAQAYSAAGESELARSTLERIAELRLVNNLGYVLVRKPARVLLDRLNQT